MYPSNLSVSLPRHTFQHIFGFGGDRFLPHHAVGFLQKLACKIFIEHFSVERILPQILSEEEALGAHSTLIHFTPQIATEWAWYHHQSRPQGLSIGVQCPSCGCLRSLVVRYNPNETIVLCTNKSCRSTAKTIPRTEWKYNCEKGMSIGSGWAYRTLWDERS